MKKTLLFLSVLFSISASAQWNIISVGTTQDLYAADYYSANDIWIGSFNQFVKTADGGGSWTVVNPLKDLTSATIAPANLYDIAVTSPTSAVATGFFLLGNVEYTLRTTNGGANWDYATSLNTGGLPRYINAVDIYSTRGMAVGNNGRMVRSTDGGATWGYITSVGSTLITDVKFGTFDTVYACGDNKVFRSVSGGASGTWTTQGIAGSYKSVACDHGVVYMGNAGTTMLKSINYGTTYSTINLPFTCTGAVYAIDKDTVLAAGSDGVYVSRNGGTYWQKYILPSYQTVKMFDFLNNNSGIAVGNAGYVLKTSNLSLAPRIPISLFSIVGGLTTYCLGATINFTNTSETGLTYTWQVNGTTFSSAYTPPSYTLNTEGTNNISLIVSNGYGSDTTTIAVNVIGHTMTPIAYTASQDSVCSGTLINFTLTGSQTGVNYQLRKGFANIGSSQAGTGGTLTFLNPTALTTTNTYNIKATRTTSCFTDSLTQNKTVYLVPASGGPVATCTPTPNLCTSEGIVNVTFGSINNTSNTLNSNYYDYTCCKITNVVEGSTIPISVTTFNSFGEYVKVWIDYNGDGAFNEATEVAFSGFSNPTVTGNITISPTFLYNQKLRMRVSSDYDIDGLATACYVSSFYCGQTEDYSIIVVPAPVVPTASFTHAENVTCTTTSTFTNTSYNATSYSWNFGDASAPSTLQNPTHTYTTSGTYTVTLTSTNPTGSSTSTQNITIHIPQVPIAMGCSYGGIFTGYVSPLYDFHFDTLTWNGYGGYHNRTCTSQITVKANSTYSVLLNLQYTYTTSARFEIFIDYNNDGILSYSELINNAPGIHTVTWGGNFPFNITIPSTAVLHTPLRMRVITYDGGYGYIFDGCAGGTAIHGGEVDDMTVFITPEFPAAAAFSADTSSYCGVTTADVQFINSSTNATTFTWDFGDGGTSTLAAPNHVYASPGMYTVKLVACNGTDCDSLIMTNYVQINSTPFVYSISTSGPITICDQSSITLSGNNIPGGTYQWMNSGSPISGATDTSYNVIASGNYALAATNSIGCTSTSAVASVTVDSTCVWPGDADNNFTVNNYDLLPIGLHYGASGIARSFISNAWQPFEVSNWGVYDSLISSDIKHVDCNGDGAINNNDTLAINLNYSSVHAIAPPAGSARATNPDLHFSTALPTYTGGDWIDVDIIAGDATVPAIHLYGIAFDFNFNATVVVPGSARLVYNNAWLTDLGTDDISISHIDMPMQQASGGVSRISHTTKSGYGTIGTFRFQADPGLLSPVTFSLVASQFTAIDSVGNIINFNTPSYSFDIQPSISAGIQNSNNENKIGISPNPFNGFTMINYELNTNSKVKIEIYNSVGQNIETILNETQTAGEHSCKFSAKEKGYDSGIYFVKISINGKPTMKRMVITK